MTRFLTQKLSWNRFTKPEHHTFVWQGVDGSEVLAHFPPADTYKAEATVPELARTAAAYKDHEHSGTSLFVFGWGDGGGGPTKAMLETLRRARDLQGLPRTTMRTSDEFFDALEAEPGERPVVVGELYFEYHRGTYTSQARTKRGNRRCETALHDAEFLAAAASRLAGAEYPQAELERLWKLLLLNQFHDILPGSSIGLVYEDAERDLAEVESGGGRGCGRGPRRPGRARRRARPAEHDRLRAPRGGRRIRTAGSASRRRRATASAGSSSPTTPSRVDGLELENAHLAVAPRAGRQRPQRGRQGLAAARRWRRRATGSSSTTTGRSPSTPGTSTRSTSRRAATARPRTRYEVLSASPLRAEVAFERAIGETSRMRQVVRLDAGARRLELHTDGRLAREPHAPQGLLPARRARAVRDVRDAVRLRGAPDALLDEPRRRAVRGAGPPLGRPLRARLRRGAPDRLEVRLQLPRQRAADQPAARPEEPGPERRHGPAPVRLRARPAPRRLARRRHRRRGDALQRAAALGRAAPARCARWRRSTTRTSCWTRSSAPRTRTRSSCGSTRRTARAASRASRLALPVRLRVPRERARGRRRPVEVDGGRLVVPYRPHEIVTIKLR